MAGFQYSRTQAGGGTTGNTEQFAVNASHSTLLAPGDAIVITGTSNSDGIPEVDTGNAATANTGVIESVAVNLAGENLTETGLPASTAGLVNVRVDQGAMFEIDADATYGAADVGLNTGINVTTATKQGGLTVSNMTADQASSAGTQTLPYRVEELLRDDNDVLGNRIRVRFNATTASDGALGV